MPLSAGVHFGVDGAFTLLTFDDEPDIVKADSQAGDTWLDDENEVAALHTRMDRIVDVALSPDDSKHLIEQLAQDDDAHFAKDVRKPA